MAQKKQVTKRKRDLRKIDRGQIHIHSTFNNTIVTVTDMDGNAITTCSGGNIGFKGSRKGTPFAAQQVTEAAVKAAKVRWMRPAEVFVMGPGSG